MEQIYFFNKQVEKTNEGTEIILKFLKEIYPNSDFIDVEHDKDYQKIDVDYIWRGKEEKDILLEIKVDTYKTGNIFYEFYSNYENKTQGCMEKTQADIIAYYFIEKDILYLIDPIKFRKYVNKYQKWLEPKFIPNFCFHSMGYAIPIKDIRRGIILEEFKNIKKNIDNT